GRYDPGRTHERPGQPRATEPAGQRPRGQQSVCSETVGLPRLRVPGDQATGRFTWLDARLGRGSTQAPPRFRREVLRHPPTISTAPCGGRHTQLGITPAGTKTRPIPEDW